MDTGLESDDNELILFFKNGETRRLSRAMKIHLARGVLSTAMGFLFFWGLGRVPLAQAVALAFIAPLIALYLASVLLKEEIGPRTVAASLVAFAGVLVIFFGQAQANLGRQALIGSLAILVSAMLYALNIIIMRRQALVADPLEITFYQSVIVTTTLGLSIPFAGIALPEATHWPWILFPPCWPSRRCCFCSVYARRSQLPGDDRIYRLLGDNVWIFFDEHVSPFTLSERC
jgi:S-adenosylmethionine uptake transporter